MARAAALVLLAAGALIIDIPLSIIAGRPAHQPAAAVPTVKKSCKQGHRFGIVRSASFGFQNPLHQFKLLCRNDCFMGVVHDYPVPHRHVHFLFGAIIQSSCLSLYQLSDIDLVVQNAVHRLGRPRRLIALAEMQAQLCTALQLSCSRGRYLFRIQSVCDARSDFISLVFRKISSHNFGLILATFSSGHRTQTSFQNYNRLN